MQSKETFRTKHNISHIGYGATLVFTGAVKIFTWKIFHTSIRILRDIGYLSRLVKQMLGGAVTFYIICFLCVVSSWLELGFREPSDSYERDDLIARAATDRSRLFRKRAKVSIIKLYSLEMSDNLQCK